MRLKITIIIGLLVLGLCLLTDTAWAIQEIGYLDFGEADEVVIDGDYAYMSSVDRASIYILDISAPESPSLVYTLSIGPFVTEIHGLDIGGDYLYAPDRNYVRKINVQNPAAPFQDGYHYFPLDEYFEIVVQGSIAYVKTHCRFEIWSVPDMALLGYLFDVQGGRTAEFVVSGNYAYIADGHKVQVIDVSFPNDPVLVYTLEGFSYTKEMAVSGDYLFVGNDGGCSMVDISNPLNPTVEAFFPTASEVIELRPYGNSLYIGEAGGILEVVDVSNPANPSLIDTFYAQDDLHEIKIRANVAYAAAGDLGLLVLDLVAPNEPPIADTVGELVADGDEIVTLDASASYDPDGTITTFTWKRLPDEVVLYSGPSATYDTKALGRAEELIELTVRDNGGCIATDSVIILNSRANLFHPELNTIGNKMVYVNNLLQFQVQAVDPEGFHMEYYANNLPGGATFNSETQTFSWTPTRAQVGTHVVNFNVNDGFFNDNEDVTILVKRKPIVIPDYRPMEMPIGRP
ncbi:putative Ig domain-containing protein [Candidatus Omnitrophota bacterium]